MVVVTVSVSCYQSPSYNHTEGDIGVITPENTGVVGPWWVRLLAEDRTVYATTDALKLLEREDE